MLVAVEGARPGPGRRVAAMSVWLLASRLLGRPVPVDEDYPHVCGQLVGTEVDRITPVTMNRAGCAACPPYPSRPRILRPVGRY